MITIAIVPFLVAVAGCLVYALASNPKMSEIGRLAYFAGLLVLLSVFAENVLRIGAK